MQQTRVYMNRCSIKGFTLIELLAVIVILAIIAVIATPIVLSIIKNSKVSANTRSAENYLDAVENAIAKENMNNILFNPSNCNIGKENGQSIINCDGIKLNVEASGNVPDSGIITFKTGKIEKVINIKLDDYYINKINDKLVSTTSPSPICTSVKVATLGNVPNGNFTPGDEYVCDVASEDSYTFFVLSKNGDDINLIMNQNIGKNVAWISIDDYVSLGGPDNRLNENSMCPASGWECVNANIYGSVTLSNELKSQTSNWIIETSIPTAKQIADIGNQEWDGIQIDSFYPLSASWLYGINGNQDYWTSTILGEETAWGISSSGLGETHVGTLSGVRPVITVSKLYIQ